MKKVIIAYVPVLHAGYIQFLEKHSDADAFFVFGQSLIEAFDYLHKEIRALKPEQLVQSLQNIGVVPGAQVLEEVDVPCLEADEIVMPDEDVCHSLAEKYFANQDVQFDPVFLRWDRTNTKKEKKVGPDRVITEDEFMNEAFKVAEHSSDWWRQVGAVVVKDGKVLFSRTNKHVPSPHQAYADGDPRNASHKGQDLDKYTTVHAEAGTIADAAREGVAIDGAEMYVTDFPCPVCAKQIATAGIKRLYFTRGYAVLDGERILKTNGVEIIEIKEKASE